MTYECKNVIVVQSPSSPWPNNMKLTSLREIDRRQDRFQVKRESRDQFANIKVAMDAFCHNSRSLYLCLFICYFSLDVVVNYIVNSWF